MSEAALVLADGAVFPGVPTGARGVAVGEAVFNTAMTGYQEVVTDPSYTGQIVAMTSPHIGNYGVTESDAQAGRPMCAGLVVRSLSRRASSWRAEGSLDAYLDLHGVVALAEVDTRRLTRHLRDRGAMAAAMGTAPITDLRHLAVEHGEMTGRDLASTVTTDDDYVVGAQGRTVSRVVAYDLGIKSDILAELTRRGLEVRVVPAGTPADAVLADVPDGVFVSNGPGDPAPVATMIQAVRQLLGVVPIFGICLGHQILGLALGADTFKLPFGHHGANHPVRRLDDGHVDITAQNHGFGVDLWSLTTATSPTLSAGAMPGPELLPESVATPFGRVRPTHQNLNDGTLEGLACLDVAAFSVQYHPEAAPGPNDAAALFDEFAALVGGATTGGGPATRPGAGT